MRAPISGCVFYSFYYIKMKKRLALLLLFTFPCVSYGMVYPYINSSFSSRVTTTTWSVKITLPNPTPTSLCWDEYEFWQVMQSNLIKYISEDDLNTAISKINNMNSTLDSLNSALNNTYNTTCWTMSTSLCNSRIQAKQQEIYNNYVPRICQQRVELISFMTDAYKRWVNELNDTTNNISKRLSSADEAANNGNYTKAINDYEEALPYLEKLDWMESVISQVKSTIINLKKAKELQEQSDKIEKERNKLTEQYNEALEYGNEWNYEKAISILEKIIKNEWTIEWWDNYDLAKKALSIYKEWKQKLEEWEKYYKETWKVPTDENTSNLPELNQAISWMYEKWLTVFNEPESFMASRWLRRDEAAKFYVQYAKQVMWKTPDYSKQWCNFKDLNEAWSDLKDIIVESCQLWLFQWNNWKFMPTQQLTNAQAITVFMRLREWYKDESWTHFANNYYESAHAQWFLYDTPLDNRENFDRYTTRWDVAKMLFRWQKTN